MFRISKRLNYGVQLMVALSREAENQPLATATLAERLSIPLPFLHQIGHALMQAGLIKALPGPKGGVRLGRQPELISLLNIVEALEGVIDLYPSPLSVNESSPVPEKIPLHIWNDLQQKMVFYFGGISLDQLSQVEPVQMQMETVSELEWPGPG